MPLPKTQRLNRIASTFVLTIILSLMLVTGCTRESEELTLADLSEGEYLYLQRIVTLERAKAIALVDRQRGHVVLDSLKAAWGDSVQIKTAAMAPAEPTRSEAVHDLLRRILIAENDSLKLAPVTRRLLAPMSEEAPEKVASPDSSKS